MNTPIDPRVPQGGLSHVRGARDEALSAATGSRSRSTCHCTG